MTTWIAKKIVAKLELLGIIDKSDEEIYVYGFFVILSKVLFLIVSISCGLILNIPIPSLIFYITFLSLRTYAGGSHAKTEVRCTILTMLSIILCLLCVKAMLIINLQSIPLLFTISGSIAVVILSPLDTASKPICTEEKKEYKKITMTLLFGWMLCGTVAWYLGWTKIVCAISVGIFIEGILLVVGVIQNINNRGNRILAIMT